MNLACKNKFCIYNSKQVCCLQAAALTLDERGICGSCEVLDHEILSERELDLYRYEQRTRETRKHYEKVYEEQFPPACHK